MMKPSTMAINYAAASPYYDTLSIWHISLTLISQAERQSMKSSAHR